MVCELRPSSVAFHPLCGTRRGREWGPGPGGRAAGEAEKPNRAERPQTSGPRSPLRPGRAGPVGEGWPAAGSGHPETAPRPCISVEIDEASERMCFG